MRSRGSAQKVLARWASVGAPVLLVLLAVGTGTTTAGAAPTTETFFTPHDLVVFSAIAPNGTRVHMNVQVMASGFLPPGDLSPEPLPYLPAGEAYFNIWLEPQDPVGGAPPITLSFPPHDASLVTNSGTVAAVGSAPVPGYGSPDAQLYFPVADSITRATLEIGAATVTAFAGDAEVPYRLQPVTIDFMTKAPVSVPVPGSAAQSGVPASPIPASLPDSGSGSSPALGLGIGALVVLAAGGAGLVSFRRRRAFYRADREGRIVLSGPPTLVAGATLPTGVALPPGRRAIVVKLLGPLEVEGTNRPVTAGPLLEIIVFLALNPGKSFTSVQLRESIWGLGRQPITSNTFRKYMVQLRKAFGPGVVVTDVYRYQLTEAVTSDWDRFRAALGADDELAGREQGLDLVRGPVLHGSFDGKKNSPFSWATGVVNDIEDQVTSVAMALALACLELADPRRATKAVSQGLLCSEANLWLRTIDLRVGAALGGPTEVGRRLEAGRAAMATFPKDVAELEEEARSLGWASVVPG